MALVYADRVKETTTTTGVGTYSLAGAEIGHQSFVAGVGPTNTCRYVVTDGTDWEVGLGTITSGTPDTLSRDTIYASSNAGAAVNWTAGTRVVFNTVPTQTIDEIVAHIAAANPHSGSAASGANSDITSLSGLTTPLTVAQGGIGTASNTAYAVLCGGTTGTAAVQSIASVGTSGQVLTSNGAGALPTFQAAAAGGGAWNLISTTTISGSPTAVDFTGLTGYTTYAFKVTDIRADGLAYLGVQVSFDNGSSWDTANNYSWHRTNSDETATTYKGRAGSSTTGYVEIAGLRISASQSMNLLLFADNINDGTEFTNFYWNGYDTTGGITTRTAGAGANIGAYTAVTAIRFTTSTGTNTFTSGKISAYGIAEA